jgi:hypothetical protein
MAQPLRQLSIPSPGNQGLNTELSPFQAGTDFALRADNAVIDRVGRLSSREAFADFINTVDFSEPSYDVVRLCRLESGAVVKEQVVSEWGSSMWGLSSWAGNSASEKVSEDMTFGLMGVGYQGARARVEWGEAKWAVDEWAGVLDIAAPVLVTEYDRYVGFKVEGNQLVSIPEISPKYGIANAQLVPFKDSIYIFSKGEEVMVYDGTTAEPLSAKTNYFPPQDDTGVIADYINGDVACAAYGRLWVSGVNEDYQTIYYSDLLVPEQWYDGKATMTDEFNTAGIIDVAEYWPNGGDKIQGIAAHNGFLVVFGRYSILVYSGAQGDPAGDPTQGGGLKLEDAISDVGLVNQDAMCSIGSDYLFVDSLGIRSLGRVIQEKSAPIGEVSMNVATAIRELIEQQRDGVRLFHLAGKNLAVCLFPETREAYVFQVGQPSQTGGLRATRWTGCDFYDGITVRTSVKDLSLLGARDNRGVTRYFGYKQPRPYEFRYESATIPVSQNIMQTVIPKSVSYSYHSDQTDNLSATWGFGEDMGYERRARPKPTYESTKFHTSTVKLNGTGEMLRVGFDISIDGSSNAMQQISINTLLGRNIV